MRKMILALAVLVSAAAFSGSASAQQNCEQIKANPADAGFNWVGIRRPAVKGPEGQAMRSMIIEIQAPAAIARIDAPNGNVMAVYACGNTVRYQVKVLEQDGFHVAELPLPSTTKAVKILSCSKTESACYTGTFEGDFTKGITLVKMQAANNAPLPKKGDYKF